MKYMIACHRYERRTNLTLLRLSLAIGVFLSRNERTLTYPSTKQPEAEYAMARPITCWERWKRMDTIMMQH